MMVRIATVDPLAYGVDGLRRCLIGVSYFGAFTDLLVLSAFAAVFLALGSYLFSRIQL